MPMTSPAQGRVTSEYGHRKAIAGVTSGTFHAGIDIANVVGTPVVAAYAGTVERTGTSIVPGRSGLGVLVRNPDGERQYYGHLNKIRVHVGDRLDAGDRIGDMGTTGNVTGPHLHFECWASSSHQSTRDPRVDFRAWGLTPGSIPAIPQKPIATSSTRYPSEDVGTDVDDLKSAWYRLLGSLDYTGDTVTRLQAFLRRSGHYAGRIDGDLGPMTISALQRRLSGAGYYSGAIDGDRGPMTRAAEAAYLNAHAWRV